MPAGLPLAAGIQEAMAAGTPPDASCLEWCRDRVLSFFAHPVVSRVCAVLALLTCVAVVGFGLLILWTICGLYFGLPSSWSETEPACALFLYVNGSRLADGPTDDPNVVIWQGIPRVHGMYVADFCNLNQRWMNRCVKAFVVLFSYINFLPIAWRLSILHHSWCSCRLVAEGLDFYGRPTGAMWFHIPVRTRRYVAILLNLAWVAHFVCLAMHAVYVEYIDSQTWPGAFAQNLPFALSIIFMVMAGVAQGKAENKLVAERPDEFPPGALKYLKDGFRKWRSGEARGSLVSVLRREMAQFEATSNPLTGIVKPREPPRAQRTMWQKLEALRSGVQSSLAGLASPFASLGNAPSGFAPSDPAGRPSAGRAVEAPQTAPPAIETPSSGAAAARRCPDHRICIRPVSRGGSGIRQHGDGRRAMSKTGSSGSGSGLRTSNAAHRCSHETSVSDVSGAI